jgi:hypothetical protein
MRRCRSHDLIRDAVGLSLARIVGLTPNLA